MKFGNEFWLILFQEYISPKLFAVKVNFECFNIRQLTVNGSPVPGYLKRMTGPR